MPEFENTRPARLDSGGAIDPWAPFRVDDTREIGALLRQLRDGSVPLVVSAPDGASMGTVIWAIDAPRERISLTAEASHPDLQRLVVGDEAAAVGYLDAVKLQFDLHDLVVVRGAQGCALQAALPQAVYRFQRRNTFRVRPPARHAPVASLRHPAIPEMRLALRVIDISSGGCALVLPDDVPPLEPGVCVRDARIELDADTRFAAALRIQHVGSIDSAEHGLRVGCEWSELGADAARALQRYIDQTQKRRRLLSLEW